MLCYEYVVCNIRHNTPNPSTSSIPCDEERGIGLVIELTISLAISFAILRSVALGEQRVIGVTISPAIPHNIVRAIARGMLRGMALAGEHGILRGGGKYNSIW